jgi:hypothetical protein
MTSTDGITWTQQYNTFYNNGNNSNLIRNGNFSSPVIATNTTKEYPYNKRAEVPDWTFVAWLSNGTVDGNTTPYPGYVTGGQTASLIGGLGNNIFQSVILTAGATYTLTFWACNISVVVNGLLIYLDSTLIFGPTIDTMTWTKFSCTVIGSGSTNIVFDTNSSSSVFSNRINVTNITLIEDVLIDNIIKNGTFSSPTLPNNTFSNTKTLDFWMGGRVLNREAEGLVGDNAVVQPFPGYVSGGQCIVLQPGVSGVTQQYILLTTGVTYNLTFWMCKRQNSLPYVNSNDGTINFSSVINVLINSSVIYFLNSSVTYRRDTGPVYRVSIEDGLQWIKYSTRFTATVTGSNTLKFEDTGASPYGFTFIANVTLVESYSIERASICYGNYKFVASLVTTNNSSIVDPSGTQIMTSSDGRLWETRSTPINNYWSSVSYGKGKFVAVGYANTVPIISLDGLSWTVANANTPLRDWQSVCFGDGIFVAVTNSGTGSRAMISNNGISWFLQTTPVDNSWQSVCYGEFYFVAVSNSGTGNRIMTSESPGFTCYLTGTKILCLVDNIETYIPIEDIRKGTLVKAYKHGYLPVKLIGKRNCVNNPTVAQNCLFKMKTTGLCITGGHFILVDELPQDLVAKYEFYNENHKVEDKYILIACDSELFEPFPDKNEYTIYHLCLESNSVNDHFGIWAEGILSESTSENDYNDGFFENTG